MLKINRAHQSTRRCPSSHAQRQRIGTFSLGLVLTLIALFVAAPVSLGQSTTGATLRGVVKDPSGAVVPNATVTLTGKQRGDQRQVKSSDEGTYVIPSVDPGTYTIKVEASGFKTYQQEELTLAPNQTRSLDIPLEIGVETETVTVTGEQSPIKTETGEQSNTITAQQIDNLSIIGRSSLELLRILPGVVAPNQQDLEVVGFQQGANATANYTVNGIRGVNNNVTIDGSRVIDIGANNGTIITPNNDMVQEVTVKSSNYAAEYGSSGVQIFATTKGGSRTFNGEIYDYLRPRSLAANDRSSSLLGLPKAKSSFNYPGGNIGGPVILPFTNFNRNRDRLFFFVGFEVQRQKIDTGSRFAVVPTQAERNGDFSQSVSVQPAAPVVNGVRQFCTPSSFQFGPCTVVPNGQFQAFASPVGRALINLFPLPNFTPAPGSPQALAGVNYASNVVSPQNRTDLKMRFDLNVTKNTKAYLRLAREAETADYPYGLWWGPSSIELPTHVIGTNRGRSAALNITSVINPTMTNEVVFSASRLELYNDYADVDKVSNSALGIQNLQLPFKTGTTRAPIAIVNGWSTPQNTQFWEPGNLPLFANNDSYSVTDTLSKIYKNHTLKFGGLLEQFNKKQNNSTGNGAPEGFFEFENSNQARTTGNYFANLYTGQINQFQQTTATPTGYFRGWNFEVFAQDSWKLRPNFTLEYGARFSYFPNVYERNGLGVVFDPTKYVRGAGAFINNDPQRPNGFLLASRGDIPKSVVPTPSPKVAPRLSFAWDIFGDASTVIRGGAGLFYNRVQGNYQYVSLVAPPNTLNTQVTSWSAPNFDLTFSSLANINPISGLQAGSFTSQNLLSNEIPQISTVSFSVARRLPFKNVLEVSYVGTFGRHLPETQNFNYVFPGALPALVGNANTADPAQRAALGNNFANLPASIKPVPFPDWGQVTLQEFVGTSNYHSMQITLNRQLGKKFQYFLTYTFSKALGTTSINETDGSDQVDPVDIRGRSYGILPYDRTHIFNFSYNYSFPDLARGSWKNWFTKGLFNGWQMSGITTYSSGRPIKLRFTGAITSDATLLSYFGTNAFTLSQATASGVAPVILRNPVTGNTGAGNRYLDLSAIQIPGFGQSGPYQSPFYIRSPSTHNFDFTFFKNFNFTESKRLQIRLGLFNAFNEAFALGDPSGPNNDINLTLNTVCNKQLPAGINNGTGQTTTPICDPTGGFSFDQNTIDTFGVINKKHGHRRIELALKFYF